MLNEKQLDKFVEQLIKHLKEEIDWMDARLNNERPAEINQEVFENSIKPILTDLVRNPGGLIYVEDKQSISIYKTAIDVLYERYDDSDILDMLSNGDFEGLINENHPKQEL